MKNKCNNKKPINLQCQSCIGYNFLREGITSIHDKNKIVTGRSSRKSKWNNVNISYNNHYNFNYTSSSGNKFEHRRKWNI